MNKNFISNVANLLTGNSIAQLIQLLALLWFSTVYKPSAFGLLATTQSAAVIAAAIFTLQMHLIIPLSGSKKEAEDLTRDVRAIALLVFLVSFIGFYFFNKVYLLAVALALIVSFNNIHCGLLLYYSDYRRLGIFYVFRAVAIVILQYLFFTESPNYGLLLGGVIGELVAGLFIMGSVRHINQTWNGLNKLIGLITRWKAFTFYGTLQELLSVAAYYMPLFIFDLKFGSEVSGQYAFASRLIWGPLIVVTASLVQVLMRHYAEGLGFNSFIYIHKIISRFCGPFFVGLFFVAWLAEQVAHNLLEPSWEIASQMLGLSIIWGGAFLLSIPYRVMLRIQRLQKIQLMIDLIVMLAYAILCFYPGISAVNVMVAIVIISFFQNMIMSIVVVSRVKPLNGGGV